MRDPHVGRIALWRYRENRRNYPGYHVSCDDPAAGWLARKLPLLQPNDRLVLDLVPPPQPILAVAANRAAAVSFTQLTITYDPGVVTLAFSETHPHCRLSLSGSDLRDLVEGIRAIKRGEGDYCIGETDQQELCSGGGRPASNSTHRTRPAPTISRVRYHLECGLRGSSASPSVGGIHMRKAFIALLFGPAAYQLVAGDTKARLIALGLITVFGGAIAGEFWSARHPYHWIARVFYAPRVLSTYRVAVLGMSLLALYIVITAGAAKLGLLDSAVVLTIGFFLVFLALIALAAAVDAAIQRIRRNRAAD